MSPEDIGLGMLPSWVWIAPYVLVGVLVVVLAVVVAFYVWSNSRSKGTPAGKVVGLVGLMGSGKTMFAVKEALRRMAKGVDVYTNFTMDVEHLGYPGKHYKLGPSIWDEIAVLTDAVVIIDEAHVAAPSHQHINFPMIARTAMAYARKQGLDVYWISQDEERVNKTLRSLTNKIGLCERTLFGGFVVRFYEPKDFRKVKARPIDRRRYKLDLGIARCYDTKEQILVDDYALRNDPSADRVRAIQSALRTPASASAGGGPSASEVAAAAPEPASKSSDPPHGPMKRPVHPQAVPPAISGWAVGHPG